MENISISKDVMQYIATTLEAAKRSNVITTIIERNRVRGTNENHTVFILDVKSNPDIGTDAIAFTNIPTFLDRFALVKNHPTLVTTARVDTTKDGLSYVRALQMKAGRTTVDCRCSNPMVIMSPTKTSVPMMCSLVLTDTDIELINKSKRALKADLVTFEYSEQDGLIWFVSDVNGDKIKTEFPSEPKPESDADILPFQYSYPLDLFIPLLSSMSSNTLYINQKGYMNLESNGLTTYIGPNKEKH